MYIHTYFPILYKKQMSEIKELKYRIEMFKSLRNKHRNDSHYKVFNNAVIKLERQMEQLKNKKSI